MDSPLLRLLIVEDSEDDAFLLVRELKRGGYRTDCERVETPETMRDALARREWDIVISDHSMPCFSGPAALRVLKESGLDLPFIIVSGSIGEEMAVECMRSGAHDYLMKDRLTRLCAAVERELAERISTVQPTLPVLFMSGYTDDAIIHHGVLESGVAFLEKPFTPDTLARRVRNMLDQNLQTV